MRLIIIMVLVIASLFAGIFDKVYVFTENKGNNKGSNKTLIKALIEKTMKFKESSLIKISGTKSIKYDGQTKEFDFQAKDIRKLYYNVSGYNGVLNFRIGRDIKSFSYGKTYSIINYLSPNGTISNPNDRTLQIKSRDGFSLTLIDRDNSKGVQNTIALHIYTKNIMNKQDQKKQSHVLELTQKADTFKRSIFIANETNANPSIAIAQKQIIGESFNETSTLKYEHNKEDFLARFSYLINLEYDITRNFLAGFEYFHLSGGLRDIKERDKKHHTFRNYEDFKDFYKNLNSKQYLSLYTKINSNNFTTTLKTLESLSDNSRKINLQITYKIDKINLHSSIAINNSKANDTEFGYLRDNFFEVEYRIFVSYL